MNAVGRSLAAAYRAIDRDARRHLAELPLLGLTMLASRRQPIAPLAADGARPILFLHGLGGGPGNFFPMRTFFAVAARRRGYAVALSDEESIDAMAERLRALVAEVAAVNHLHGARIDLVAHSMGGLVARAALEDPATAALVANLVTLGTPHRGTWAARFAATARALDLRPDSPLLTRLARQLPWAGPPSLPRLVSFWSASDMLLLPHATAIVDGAEAIELPDMTHTGWLLRPSAWRAALAALA